MKKLFLFATLILILIAPFCMAAGPVVDRGDRVITGDLYLGGTIHNDALYAAIGASSGKINHTYYVDGSRTETYTEDGSILRPYKTIAAAQTAINTVSATLLSSAANFELCKFIVKIAPGKYTDNITITTARYLRYEMDGVEISGNISITQNQLGLTDYYGKVEFVGGAGNRAYRGNCGLISGNITFLKDAYDSLAYDGFIGVNITGNVSYGTAEVATHGTWVLYLQNAYFGNGAKFISAYLTDPTEHVMIESYGYNKILSHIAKQDGSATAITLFDVNDTYLDLVNITPLENGKVKNSTFNSTTSIVAVKTLSLDANSYKSLATQSPTTTGMTLAHLDGSMAAQASDAVAITGGSISGATVQLPEKTPVNAVAASGVVTFSGQPLAYVAEAYASGVLTVDGTPVAEEQMTVGAQLFTFVAAGTEAGNIVINATPATQAANIVTSITRDLATVTAVAEGAVITVTAAVPGVAGNAIDAIETATGVAWSSVTEDKLDGGVDGVLETLTIGTQAFKFVTLRGEAGSFEITSSDNTTTQAANAKAAINADLTNVTADNTDAVLTVTAAVKGVSGNLIALSESATGTAVSSVTGGKLDGGIDGTVGLANETCADASYIYHAIAANTIADANWRRLELLSF
jgi:hypothetical protein